MRVGFELLLVYTCFLELHCIPDSSTCVKRFLFSRLRMFLRSVLIYLDYPLIRIKPFCISPLKST